MVCVGREGQRVEPLQVRGGETVGLWARKERGTAQPSLSCRHGHRQRPEHRLFSMNKRGHGEWGNVRCTSRPSPVASCLPWEAVTRQFLITSWVLMGTRILPCPLQQKDHQLLLFHGSSFLVWDQDHRELALSATSLLLSK